MVYFLVHKLVIWSINSNGVIRQTKGRAKSSIEKGPKYSLTFLGQRTKLLKIYMIYFDLRKRIKSVL